MKLHSEILEYLHYHPESSRSEITDGIAIKASPATLKRAISEAVEQKLIHVTGKGKATKYSITPQAHVLMTFDIDTYFEKEIDERTIQQGFNFELIQNILPRVILFSDEEFHHLNGLQATFTKNISQLSPLEYAKEMERLGIDLSWKSSQIEGNTYSLLETERLLTEREEAKGKSKEEAIMLLNHKEALKFILQEPDYLETLTVSHIEDIHSILTDNLNVDRNIRSRDAHSDADIRTLDRRRIVDSVSCHRGDSAFPLPRIDNPHFMLRLNACVNSIFLDSPVKLLIA